MKATVVMPAYNAQAFLGEAIESVLRQSHVDFDLIIVDDGSTDDTRRIAERYASIDNRITLISRENRGICASLNEGIEAAGTDWVAIMHADDVMERERIERQLAFVADQPDLGVASTFVYYIDGRGRRIGKFRSELSDESRVAALYRAGEIIAVHHPAVVLRKSVAQEVGGYRQRYWPCEDIDLWNRIIERGYRILVQPEFLLSYRLHGDSASVSRARLLRLKHRWVRQSMLARRKNDREPTWEAFLEGRNKLPWRTRWNQERKDLAKAFYKAAVLQYAQRRYAPLVGTLLCAAALQPMYVFRQVRAKYDGGLQNPSYP